MYSIMLIFAVFLSSCENQKGAQNKLKILHSFFEEEPFFQVWETLSNQFRDKYSEIQLAVLNAEPQNILIQIKQLQALQSLPNLLYADPYSQVAKYLHRQNLLQDLRQATQQPPLSSIAFSPLALSPQYSENLYFLPFTVKLDHVLFANGQILEQENLSPPYSIAELQQSIKVLRQRGYEYPLVAHFSYLRNIVDNLLGPLVAQNIGLHFFRNIEQQTELFQSKAFRSVLEQYISHLEEGGILSPSVRSLGIGTSVEMFNNGEAVFLLAEPDVADSLTQPVRSSAIWVALQANKLKSGQIVIGHIEKGYAMTKQNLENQQLQNQVIDFFYFVFTKGIALYKSNDTLNQIFSVSPSLLTESISSIYAKKWEFYLNTNQMAPGIRKYISSKEYELLRNRSERVASGFASMDMLLSTFYGIANRYRIYRK